MDVLFWIGFGCTVVVAFFVVAIALFGGMAFRSPWWDMEFYSAAWIEWHRRGLDRERTSITKQGQLLRMTGRSESPEEPDDEVSRRAVGTVGALIGYPDLRRLQTYLDRRSTTIVTAALTRHFAAVRDIANLSLASRVWVVVRWMSIATALYQGLVWFLPRCFATLRKRVESHMTVATILGIGGGLLVWGFTSLSDGSHNGVSWIEFVGIVVTFATVLALVLGVGQQFVRVIVTVVAPVRAWTVKGVATALLPLSFGIGIMVLYKTGQWDQWQLALASFSSQQLAHTKLGEWIGVAMMLAVVLWAIRRAVAWARHRGLTWGDRIGAVGGAVFFALMGVMIVLFVLDAPAIVTRVVLYAVGLVIGVFVVLNALFDGAEWARKYRDLRRAGIVIRRGWFRWWLLWAWLGAFVGASAVTMLVSALAPEASLGDAILLVMDLVMAIAWLMFWPGVVTVIRYMRRVLKAHEQYAFERSREAFETEAAEFLAMEHGAETRDP